MDASYHNPSDSKKLHGKPHPLHREPGAGKVTTPLASRRAKRLRAMRRGRAR